MAIFPKKTTAQSDQKNKPTTAGFLKEVGGPPPSAKEDTQWIREHLDERRIAALAAKIAQGTMTETQAYRQSVQQTLGGILSVLEMAGNQEQGAENPFDQLTEALLRMEEISEQRHTMVINSFNELASSFNSLTEAVVELRGY